MVIKKRKHGGSADKSKKKNKKTQPATQPADLHAVEVASNDVQLPLSATAALEEEKSVENDILSAELRAELGGNADDVMVIVGNKKKKTNKTKEDDISEEVVEQAAKLSKSKRKKLEQIAARKIKEARREELYKSLEKQQLTQQQMELMHSTSRLGHKETLRERLKRSMNRQRAGLELSAEAQEELVKKKTQPEEDGDEAMHEEEQNEEEHDVAKPPTVTRASEKQQPETKGTKKPANMKVHKNTTESIDELKQVDSENGKKKRRKRSKVAHNIVPLAPTQSNASSSPATTSTVNTQPDSSTTSNSAELASIALTEPNAAGDDIESQPISSQSDAMAKLAALRKKNEEKRRQKALAAAQPQVTIEDETPTNPSEVYVPQPIVLKTTEEMRELSKKTKLSYKTTLVQLKRKPEIQLARMQLPVCSSEQEIMEAITDNDVIILCGETGSGKTTQVPQFLYEAGYGHPDHLEYNGRIGVTQPRRVAAVSTAKRVAEELNVEFGGKTGHVGYQIRYDAEHVCEHTRIKFMTDGILLKEIQQDFLLQQYSILLLDEAHERNVNTDILIGLLSRIAPLRAQMAKEEQEAYALLSDEERQKAQQPIKPLKLVIMSATLRVEDFTQNQRLFPNPPPVLRVDARQYPVTVHFNKRTELENYVDEAYKKVIKIHKKLPEGGVLVFLTGQREILQLCRKLRRSYSSTKGAKAANTATTLRLQQRQPIQKSANDRILREHDDIEEEADLEDAQVYGAEDETCAFKLDDEEDKNSSDSEEDDEEEELAVPYLHVLPLYSLMPNDEQMKVFEAPPEKHRLIVVATNVAETSLTIPGIKYVVDAGRTKERVFDLANGISSFEIQWISKASADQRAGRAGRTGPGHCYRLYSSAVYDTEFKKFSSPEILCQPIDDLVLQMKAMGIHNVLQFPFPTPPDRQAVKNALTTLMNLGAITEGEEEVITPLGHVLVKFPVATRFAKMLLLAKELNVLEYTIAIVAGLSGHSPFILAIDNKDKEKDANDAEDEDATDEIEKEWKAAEELRKHAQWIDTESDVLSLLRAAGAYAYTGGSSQFCQENYLHEKTMQNMLKLRQQLTRIVNQLYTNEESEFTPIKLSPKMPPPNHDTQVILRQILAAGFLDQVAKRVPPGTITEGTKIERNCAYITATGTIKEPVYIHPHSSVFSANPAQLPTFVVYQHIMRTSRAYMKTVTAIEPAWLASIGKNTPLCKYSQPLTDSSPPVYDEELDEIQCYAKAQYGTHQWALPIVRIPYPEHDQQEEKDGLSGKYRWFAKFLLDGQVIRGLQSFAGSALREPSHLVIRKKFDKKIQLLVLKLQKNRIASRHALQTKWREDKTFLKTELKAWIKDSHHAEFNKVWASIVRS